MKRCLYLNVTAPVGFWSPLSVYVVRFVNGSSSSQLLKHIRRYRLLSLGFSILQIVTVISWKQVRGGLSCIIWQWLWKYDGVGTTILESAVVIVQVNTRQSYSTTSIQSTSSKSRVIEAKGRFEVQRSHNIIYFKQKPSLELGSSIW